MMTKLRLLGVYAAGIFLLAISLSPMAQAQNQRLAIADVQTARDVKSGRPVDVREIFTPSSDPIHVWMRVSGHDVTAKLSARWFYITGGVTPLGTGQVEVSPNEGWAHRTRLPI